jgi:hypothetical protein
MNVVGGAAYLALRASAEMPSEPLEWWAAALLVIGGLSFVVICCLIVALAFSGDRHKK